MTYSRVIYLLFMIALQFSAPLHAAFPEVSQGQIVQIKDMQSEFVSIRDISVWLPIDFAEDRQYAVLYMNDGDMLFDASKTSNGLAWGMDEIATRLMAEGTVRDFIVVAIPTAGPEKSFSGPIRSDAYLRFLVEELKPHIDENFPVLGNRDNTLILGSGKGGLISIYAIREYPDVFGGAAYMSTHWPGISSVQNNPFPELMRDDLLENLPPADKHRIWFEDDTEEHDALRFHLDQPLTFLLAPEEQKALARVSSPDGQIRFSLAIDRFGTPRYSVKLADETIIFDSRLGLRFEKQAAFDLGLQLIGNSTSRSDETWEQPWGERRLVRDFHNELLLEFADESGGRFDVRVRVFDDGLGFRYEVPGQSGFEEINIVDELTEFGLPKDSTAWWIPGRRFNRYEYIYNTTGLEEIETAHTPMTVRTPRGTHLSIHEAALVDYAGFVLDQRRDNVFQTNLTPWSDGTRVKTSAPFHSPWRTIQVSENAAGLLNSSLILNLNEPNKLGDVSWVKPGKYVGIWWAMHIRKRTWGSGPIHGATTDETKRYMDFAARYGFDGVLVEGWNTGWDGDWFFNGDLFSFTEPYPDFDIRAVSGHGAQQGVRLIGHHETSGNVTNYANQMNDAFDLYESVGVRQVKTGYVADGGGIKRVDEDGVAHYEWHDGQFMAGQYLLSVTEAAKRKISINTHEPIKDTGLRRTYPNWISREGARGQEFNAWGSPPNPPEHTAILPYTRLLAGPMDFTPGIFDLTFQGVDSEQRVQTTLAKQLALYVVIYSPIQMAADLPENYEARPDAFQFILDVPTDWEESIALAGEVGSYVAIARQERGGREWYLGALTNQDARHMEIELDFLEPETKYKAQIYRDGADADWKINPYSMVIEEGKFVRGDTLKMPLAPGGGAAVRFIPGPAAGAE